jgi:ABC-2 type transport system permease protein
VNPAARTQIAVLARRSLLKTLRQPFQLFPVVFFPAMLLAVNASGLGSATKLPGFPTDSYVTFALAVAFVQGGLFALVNTGTNVAADVETGFLSRLSLTPLGRVSLLSGQLAGIAGIGIIQSIAYIAMGLIGGGHIKAGVGGALVLILLGTLIAVAFGSIGTWVALRTGSGEAVQGMFPLFFVLIFLSSSNLPRDLLKTGWFHTVATWNPVSYLLEGLRSLLITGWDGTALWRAFAVVFVILGVGLFAAQSGLKTRMAR